MSRVRSQDGIALVLTLMILVIITAVVVEFTYGVYTTTSALYNWRDSQRLSFVAKSGISVAAQTVSNPSMLGMSAKDLYKYLGRQIPLENLSEGFKGRVIVSAEDENGKFNLNSIVYQNGLLNTGSYECLKRLLGIIGLREDIADRVADWIHRGSVPALRDYGENSKNDYMYSVDELLLIKGIDRPTYEKLLPYVTVYCFDGRTDSPLVNVNTASVPVIMSLANISKERAETIMNEREVRPFNTVGEAANIVALPTVFFAAGNPRNFRITAIGEENGIRRVIESVIDTRSGNHIKYWRET